MSHSPYTERDRCFFEGVVHGVSVSEGGRTRSRLWTLCDLGLDWGDRAGNLTPMTAWTTDKPITCLDCIARTS